jgi:hypothetical protein
VFEGTQDSLVADHQSLIGLFGMVVAADSAGNTIRDAHSPRTSSSTASMRRAATALLAPPTPGPT